MRVAFDGITLGVSEQLSLVKSRRLRDVVPDRLVGIRREYVSVSSGAAVLAAPGPHKPAPE